MQIMTTGTWDIFFNLLLFVFWFRIWSSDDRDTFFNPHLALLNSFSKSAIKFLRPAFFGTPDRLIAVFAIAFLILLRGIAMPSSAAWILMLGLERAAINSSVQSCIMFSLLSFMIFLFNIWGLSIIYVHSRSTPRDHTAAAVFQFAGPFSSIRPEFRPLVLLAVGIILAAGLDLYGTPAAGIYRQISIQGTVGWHDSPGPVILTRLGIVSIAGWAQILGIIRQFVIMLIIGSWMAMFMGSMSIQAFCREWLNFLLGPMRNYPVRIGMIDLSPIVFFFIIGFIHSILLAFLMGSFNRLI